MRSKQDRCSDPHARGNPARCSNRYLRGYPARCTDRERCGKPPGPSAARPWAAAAAMALAVLQLAAASTAAAQAALSALTGPAGLLGRLYPDAACAEQQVIGQCFCGPIVCGVRVRRYVPVAVVETTRAPGDSLLGLPVPGGPFAGAAASSSLSMTDNTAEVHVWSLPDGLVPGLACLTCGPSAASQPAPVVDVAARSCGPAFAVARATQAAAVAGPWLPMLAYASELDAVNWRTGCRDLADPRFAAVPPLLACGGRSGEAADTADAGCLGAWGPLRPRQMRDIGPPPMLYSAKTAVRAMSIARDQIGSFPYPVDTDGKLQQVYPAASACFRVGQLPLPQLPDVLRPALSSADGRYAWIYWRQATCCVGLPAARQCLRRP